MYHDTGLVIWIFFSSFYFLIKNFESCCQCGLQNHAILPRLCRVYRLPVQYFMALLNSTLMLRERLRTRGALIKIRQNYFVLKSEILFIYIHSTISCAMYNSTGARYKWGLIFIMWAALCHLPFKKLSFLFFWCFGKNKHNIMFCLPNRLPNELAVLGPDINFIKCSNQCSLDHQAAYLKSRKSLFRISGIWTKPFSPILTNVPVVCMRKGGGRERDCATKGNTSSQPRDESSPCDRFSIALQDYILRRSPWAGLWEDMVFLFPYTFITRLWHGGCLTLESVVGSDLELSQIDP